MSVIHVMLRKNRLSEIKWGSTLVFQYKGGPIGLQLRASNEDLLRARVARAKETNGPPLSSYTGRDAKPAGLVSDRTRSFGILEFFPFSLEFLPNPRPHSQSPIPLPFSS